MEEIINHKLFKIFLDSRLIPLNKKFPNCPKIDDIRPIVVTSQLIKFIEMRFAEKLKKYMNDRLERTQTGFVPGMGTEVNIVRLLNKLKEKRQQRPIVLFIDFSNAYNTIFHKKLFQTLRDKKILTEDEIQFLEGLYSRINIRIGIEKFRPTRGVMQGSPISPYLFDIYMEGLIDQIKKEFNSEMNQYLCMQMI